jgi:hypothetical protein
MNNINDPLRHLKSEQITRDFDTLIKDISIKKMQIATKMLVRLTDIEESDIVKAIAIIDIELEKLEASYDLFKPVPSDEND